MDGFSVRYIHHIYKVMEAVQKVMYVVYVVYTKEDYGQGKCDGCKGSLSVYQ